MFHEVDSVRLLLLVAKAHENALAVVLHQCGDLVIRRRFRSSGVERNLVEIQRRTWDDEVFEPLCRLDVATGSLHPISLE